MADVFPDELRNVFRLALKPHADIVSVFDNADKERGVPAFRELIKAILFSRRLIPTYLAVLAVSIVIFVVSRWTAILVKRWLRRKSRMIANSENVAKAQHEGRSQDTTLYDRTLCNINSMTQSADKSLDSHTSDDENTPLLYARQPHQGTNSSTARIWSYTQAFLLRQPRPVPSLTSPKNTLPENGTTIVILLFLVLNLFYLFYQSTINRYMAFAWADRAGLLFVANLPVLYVLAAKNNQPLKWLTGWSYEGLNIYHRRLGEWMTIMALIHFAGMIISYFDLLAPAGLSLGWYLTRKIIIFGWIALIMYVAIYFTSIGYFRQKFYELFLALHITLQVSALVMIFLHHHGARVYVGAAAAIWLLDRIVTRILLKTRTFIATLEIAEDQETVLLYCEIPLHKSWGFSAGITRGWHAGQHVFLSVPSISLKHRAQAHPFTIASPAPPGAMRDMGSDSPGKWPLHLIIRAQDGFSRELLEYARFHQHTMVTLDGPYGGLEALKDLQDDLLERRVCFVAGGSGIAVTYPLAWAHKAGTPSIENITFTHKRYKNGKRIMPNVYKDTTKQGSSYAHFWIRQDANHENWLTMLPSIAPLGVDEATQPNAHDLITDRFNTRSSGTTERPDIQLELAQWVQRSKEWEQEQERNDARAPICIVVSGPDGLVRDVRNTAANLTKKGWIVNVHVEKFGW